jgi:hypothetical protein
MLTTSNRNLYRALSLWRIHFCHRFHVDFPFFATQTSGSSFALQYLVCVETVINNVVGLDLFEALAHLVGNHQ